MAGSVQAAMDQAMADEQARQGYYKSHVGVPVGTTGADPQPLPLPADRAVAGTGGGR